MWINGNVCSLHYVVNYTINFFSFQQNVNITSVREITMFLLNSFENSVFFKDQFSKAELDNAFSLMHKTE